LKLVDEMGLVENSASTGKYLLDQLTEAFADHPNVAQVRGEGLMCAVEFAQSKSPVDFFDPTKKIGYQISTAMANRDVIARAMPQGDIIGFAPPLCITPDEVDQVVAVAKEAVAEVLG
jgi:L-2,4-diaminobutyrate transaminase